MAAMFLALIYIAWGGGLKNFELSQDRAVIRLESRTGGGRQDQEGVIVLPVDRPNPVKNVTRSVSGSGD